ncbi:MAG: nuclear transport factor 2 family protein [Vannielia sp.]|uniref:YybH family protein n=1 Tax=Rhodobacterales TaxID=204455 RepID=UPI00209482AA|nr:nuclear transport factor 2 family protein [Oceanicola sp. 502str15]MCO6383836.1 DUF4440 domain-containing protein [Oceanicola sp. 502str15]
MPYDFNSFMERREAAARAYVAGDAAPVVGLSAEHGQATFFDPGGGVTQGAEVVNAANSTGAASFAPGSETHFEVLDSGAADGLAFWTGYQHAEVQMAGGGARVPMKLRVTEVFRREGEGWKMIHRHASLAKDDEAPGG